MEYLTNRGIEVTMEEMEKEMNELKSKMREITKTEKEGEKARGQRDKTGDRRRRDAIGSDQEGREVSQEKVRARGRSTNVDN